MNLITHTIAESVMKQTSRRLFLAFAFLAASNADMRSQSYSGGWGTTTNPYLIATKADLKDLAQNSSEWGKHFVQTADIYLVASDFQYGGDFYNGGKGFPPIGDYAVWPNNGFTGSYDGYGHVIDGVTITSGSPYRGLFGLVYGSIARLGVTNVYVASSRGDIGALAATVKSGGSVARCYSSGYLVTTGYLQYGTAGGLVGYLNGSISESYSTCTVTSTQVNSDYGGLAGGSSGTITDSYARGNVGTGSTSTVGGLVGRWVDGAIRRSYSTGAVSGTNSTTTHGFLGYSSTSSVYPDSACFWDTQTSGWSSGGGNATGQTTANMQTASTFTGAGWDFTNTWEIVGSNYPTLRALPADTLGPVVHSLTPADDGTLTDGAGTIVLLFDEIVVAQSVGSVRIYTSADVLVETIGADDARIVVSGRAVTIDPDAILNDVSYYVQVDSGAFKDLAGNDFGGFTDSTTWNFIVDDPAPTIQSIGPDDGGVVSHADTSLVITFSESVSAQGGKNVSLFRFGSGLAELIPATDPRVSVSGATVTIDPDTLPVDGNYYILIEAGAFKDLAGLSFTGVTSDTVWNFTVSDPAPTVSSLTPTDGTTLTSSPATISLSFGEPVYAASGKSITIFNVNDDVMEQIPANDDRITVSGANVTIDPDTLLPNWDYYVQIEAGAFTDAGGRAFAGILDESTWNLTVDETKVVTTGNATSIGTSSAVLNASINPENDTVAVRFFVGTSSGSYTDTVDASPGTVWGNSTTPVTTTLSGLTGGATYYYKVTATSATENIEGNEKSFATLSAVWGSTLTFNSASSQSVKSGGPVTSETDSLTLEAWVKWDGTNTGLTQLIVSNGRLDYEGYSICLYPDTRIGLLVNGVSWYISDTYLTAGTWSHLAVVRDSLTWSLYKDGQMLSIGSATAAPNTPTSALFVGGETSDFFFNGEVDEVRVSTIARYSTAFTPTSWPFDTDTNTVALYHFNEGAGSSAADASGNGYDLTLFNGPGWAGRSNADEPAPAGTVPGSALDFAGTLSASHYVEVPYSSMLNPSDNFTVELWARTEGGAGSYRCPLGSEDSYPYAQGYYFYAASDDTWQVWVGDSNWVVIGSGVPVVLDTWTHLALTFSAGTAKFYVNGTLKNTVGDVGFQPNTAAPFRIGEIGESPGYVPFAGKVDEIRIWHVVRTQQQIREAMHRTMLSYSTGLVAYFQLNEATGTNVSGLLNGISGTITGSPSGVASSIPAGNGTSTTQSAFTTGTASLGTVSMTMSDGFDNAVDLTGTEIGVPPDSTTGISGTTLSDRYWVINSFGTPGTFAANLTFTVPSTFTNNGTASAATYTLYHRDGNGEGAWSAAATGASGLASTTVTFDGVSSFSQFTIGTDYPLPVQMTNLAAHIENNSVRLSWQTVTEVDNSGWVVERRAISMDYGLRSREKYEGEWKAVGFVEGAGTSTSPREYSFNDRPSPGRYAYRLRQFDRSGNSSISQEMEVEVGLVPREFKLGQNYPNPFNPTTTIDFTLAEDGHATLKVFNMLGQEVATLMNEDLKAGIIHQAKFNADRFATGVYIARLEVGGKPLLRKLLLLK